MGGWVVCVCACVCAFECACACACVCACVRVCMRVYVCMLVGRGSCQGVWAGELGWLERGGIKRWVEGKSNRLRVPAKTWEVSHKSDPLNAVSLLLALVLLTFVSLQCMCVCVCVCVFVLICTEAQFRDSCCARPSGRRFNGKASCSHTHTHTHTHKHARTHTRTHTHTHSNMQLH